MRATVIALAVVPLLAVTLCFGQDQPLRPMTVDDILDMVRVGGGILSPDGAYVLYSTSELDWSKNKRNTKWFKIPSTGGEPYQFKNRGFPGKELLLSGTRTTRANCGRTYAELPIKTLNGLRSGTT